MSLILNESLVLAKTRSQDLKSVLKLNCWGSGIKDVSLVRQLVNVEVIGLSCNEISSLEDFAYCQKLRELILRKNKIMDIAEVAHLQRLPNLTSLWLDENPCAETTHNYRKVVLKALPQLTVLDNKPVSKEELREIEELGNEIYEEIPYESSHSSGSGQPTQSIEQLQQQQQQQQYPEQANQSTFESLPQEFNVTLQPQQQQPSQSVNERSIYPPTVAETPLNANESMNQMNESMIGNRSRCLQFQQQSSRLSSQGSMGALNTSQSQSNWSSNNIAMNINNNNSILPKGGKSRNGNILSAVLCLVKELDYVSCEVVKTAVHCRMEETSQ